mmetsp:Transcript_79623/g.247937  ORF Transcript_79623/g.247937 Transcript_79623/m.247937 type:complete len:259 (+) Transcript_79623:64-840(+)
MSYTTTSRYGEVRHVYAAGKAKGFVQGAWWPDFGPMSYDYSYQENMHPTNTVFKNVIEKPSRKADPEAVMADRMTPGACASGSPSISSAASPPNQFRRPLPATEALYSSTIIQPYKSGGRGHGNLGKGREGSWYEKPELPSSPTSSAATVMAQIEGTLSRASRASMLCRSTSLPSVPSPSHASLRMPGSAQRSPDARRSTSSSRGSASVLPSWVASQTLMSRADDAAGRSGAPKMQGGVKPINSSLTSPSPGQPLRRS